MHCLARKRNWNGSCRNCDLNKLKPDCSQLTRRNSIIRMCESSCGGKKNHKTHWFFEIPIGTAPRVKTSTEFKTLQKKRNPT